MKVWILRTAAKKLWKAFSKCRKACWVGTLDTSLSHAVSGCCFNVVSAAEVAW